MEQPVIWLIEGSHQRAQVISSALHWLTGQTTHVVPTPNLHSLRCNLDGIKKSGRKPSLIVASSPIPERYPTMEANRHLGDDSWKKLLLQNPLTQDVPIVYYRHDLIKASPIARTILVPATVDPQQLHGLEILKHNVELLLTPGK